MVTITDRLSARGVDRASVCIATTFLIICANALILVEGKALAGFVTKILIATVTFYRIIVTSPTTFNFGRRRSGCITGCSACHRTIGCVRRGSGSSCHARLYDLGAQVSSYLCNCGNVDVFSSVTCRSCSNSRCDLKVCNGEVGDCACGARAPICGVVCGVGCLVRESRRVAPSGRLCTGCCRARGSTTAICRDECFLPGMFYIGRTMDT